MDSIQAVKNIIELSNDTETKLENYVRLVCEWQKIHNLVSSASLANIWSRHIADSVQTHLALPKAQRWVDFGSGAGFPGVILAILLTSKANSVVNLVESNRKKAMFLQTVAREIEIPVQVHCERIENFVANWVGDIDGVAARALTNLDDLCGYAEKLVKLGATAVFHKGQRYQEEIDKATKKWDIKLQIKKSEIDPNGCLLIIDYINSKR